MAEIHISDGINISIDNVKSYDKIDARIDNSIYSVHITSSDENSSTGLIKTLFLDFLMQIPDREKIDIEFL